MPDSDPELAHAATMISAYRLVSPGAESVGFRTQQFRFDNASAGVTPRPADEFLVASRIRRADREFSVSAADYFADPMVTTFGKLDHDPAPEAATVELPPSLRLRMEVGEAILRRRSVRMFSADPAGLDQVATLVRSCAAVTAESDVELQSGDSTTYRFRAVPSGGGLYPVEVHVVALSVTGLDRGVYRYQPLEDRLVATGTAADVDALLPTFCIPEDVITLGAASAVLLFVGRPWRSMRKYGPRGMRFTLHEVGAMAQNVHLAANGLGLGSTDCSSYYDDEAHEVLGIDGVGRALLHTLIVGWPA